MSRRERGTTGWPVRLTLPLPKSLNRIYRINPKTDGVYLIAEAKRYKGEVEAELQKHMHFAGIARSAQQIKLHLWVFWPNRSHSRDVANLEKLLCDALKGILFDDDCQVFPQFHPPHHYDKRSPRVEILAEEWDGETDDAPVWEGYTTPGLERYAEIERQKAEARKQQGIAQAKLTRKVNKALGDQPTRKPTRTATRTAARTKR